jgi:hypothetical protein
VINRNAMFQWRPCAPTPTACRWRQRERHRLAVRRAPVQAQPKFSSAPTARPTWFDRRNGLRLRRIFNAPFALES